MARIDENPDGPDNPDDGAGDDDDDDDAIEAQLVEPEDGYDAERAIDAELVEPAARKRGPGRKLTASGKALAKRGTAPLARYDPLQAYMRDVQRYKLLTREEEREAAIKYYEHGDVDAAATLVTANLRLVVKIAYEYRRAHQNLADLVQEGSIGLMQAVKKYDPYKGVKLSTYGAWWIRAYILRFILNNARLVKLGTTQAQRKLFFNLRKEKAKLSAKGIEPSAELIAERLNVPKEEVIQMERRLSAGDQSLDAPLRSDDSGSTSRLDLLPSTTGPIDEALADAEAGEMVRNKLQDFGRDLTGKDAIIFHERMLSEDPRTLQNLGDELGVSRERVRQLEKRLQGKLKDFLAAELDESVLHP